MLFLNSPEGTRSFPHHLTVSIDPFRHSLTLPSTKLIEELVYMIGCLNQRRSLNGLLQEVDQNIGSSRMSQPLWILRQFATHHRARDSCEFLGKTRSC